MNHRKLVRFFAILGVTAGYVTTNSFALRAGDPMWGNQSSKTSTYRIIPRPLTHKSATELPFSSTNNPSPPYAYETRPTEPYAYGWFGSKSTQHWSRHFGFGGHYSQWTLK